MPFVRMRGVKGLVFVPEEEPAGKKKHPCPDCKVCQWCSDTRCASCRKSAPPHCRRKRKR